VLPFLVGLQYSHLEKLKVFNRLGTKLSTGYWLRLTCAEMSALALVVLFLIPFLGFHLWLLVPCVSWCACVWCACVCGCVCVRACVVV
jgi:hypothetical protein